MMDSVKRGGGVHWKNISGRKIDLNTTPLVLQKHSFKVIVKSIKDTEKNLMSEC